jgi:4-amino-4-deoxy-L-arabinose transferase-like glycosyltransferase
MTINRDSESSHALIPIRLRYVLTGFIVVVAIFLLFYRLDQFPVPWYDEGSHLHVAKNFALHGVYADSSSEGYRPFGPAVGVGPTVMLPIAALFRLAGISIPAARLVIVVYSLVTLLAVYWLTRRFTRHNYALLAATLLLLVPVIRYVYYSRTVVGEVPGLAFLLLGLWLWLRPGQHTFRRLLGIGILMGLACITKNQYAFFILPSLLLNWIADRVWYRRRAASYYVIPGIVAGLMFGTWTYIVIIQPGSGDNFADSLATLREAADGALIVLTRDSLTRVFAILADSGLYGTLFIPAFIYGTTVSLPRNEEGQQYGTIMIFLAVSTAFFVVSLGWDRYAFAPATLVVVFVVVMIRDLVHEFKFDWNGWRNALGVKSRISSRAIFCLVAGWLFVVLIAPTYLRFNEVTRLGNGNAYQVKEWLNAHAPEDALIETWEQELGVLTDHRFHYPPQITLAYSVAAQWQNGPEASQFYDFREYGNPEYVIVGPFGVYTGLYPTERLIEYDLKTVIGAYSIYQHQN